MFLLAVMMPLSFPSPVLSLLLSFVIYVGALSLTSTGGTVMLGDVPYYVPATPYTTISAPGVGRLQYVNGLSPITVVSSTARNASVASLGSIVADFAKDDVWNTGFLHGRCCFPAVNRGTRIL